MRAEDRALVVRWTCRWERLGEAPRTAVPPGDDRATIGGKVPLSKLGVDEVRELVLAPHRLSDHAEAWGALKVDGARLHSATTRDALEALGVTKRSHLARLQGVLKKLRAEGVPEAAIRRAYARRAEAQVVLETTAQVAGSVVLLEVFRGAAGRVSKEGCWAVVSCGPGGGCRVSDLEPLTRYRFRAAVLKDGKQISKYASYAFATTGPPPPKPRLSAWFKTPPDPRSVTHLRGPGWSERTCELLLDGGLPEDAAFVVESRDDDDPDAPWRRCYRGRLPRVRATSLAAGRTYAFRAAIAVAEAVVSPFSEALVLRAPGAVTPGGATVDTRPPRPKAPRDDADRRGPQDDLLFRSVGGSEWRLAWSPDLRRPFYHNVKTGLSQWTPPLRAWES